MSKERAARIATVFIVLSGILAACTAAGDPLPHSVYYLYGAKEAAQVWRLETDGLTTAQLTQEGAGVSHFAVSPADGSLAFVSENKLFLVNNRRQNRRLIADGSLVDKNSEDYAFRGFIEDLVFSPNGRTLAYAFDGLHLYNVNTGKDEHVLTNLGNLLGEPFVFTKEKYSPGAWSPDGRKLLIIMSYFEGSTLAVMEVGKAEPFRRLWSEGPVCCTHHWTADSSSVLVANPSFGIVWPGLWRYDAQTSEKTDLVLTLPNSAHYVGWPVELPSGDLLYFHGEQFSPESGIPLIMVRSSPQGNDRIQVRPEEFHIADALWAEDGSLVLITQCFDSNGMEVILARPDQSPLQALVTGDSIRNLAWGP